MRARDLRQAWHGAANSTRTRLQLALALRQLKLDQVRLALQFIQRRLLLLRGSERESDNARRNF
jgi:hypothetical protein